MVNTTKRASRLLAFVTCSALPLIAGCDGFDPFPFVGSSSQNGRIGEVRLSDALPNAITDLFHTCLMYGEVNPDDPADPEDPLPSGPASMPFAFPTVAPGEGTDPVSLDPLPVCAEERTEAVDDDFDDMEPIAKVFVSYLQDGNIPGLDAGDLYFDVNASLGTEQSSFAAFPWPLQNCSVAFSNRTTLHDLSFQAVDAQWEDRVWPSGASGLVLHLENPEATGKTAYRLATRSTIADARCPNPINEAALQAKLDNTRLNASGIVTADMYSVQLALLVRPDGNRVDITPEVSLDIGNLDYDINYGPLREGTARQIQDRIDGMVAPSISRAERRIEGLVRTQASMLTSTLENLINARVPDGHLVCDVSVENGELVVHTQQPFAQYGCGGPPVYNPNNDPKRPIPPKGTLPGPGKLPPKG